MIEGGCEQNWRARSSGIVILTLCGIAILLQGERVLAAPEPPPLLSEDEPTTAPPPPLVYPEAEEAPASPAPAPGSQSRRTAGQAPPLLESDAPDEAAAGPVLQVEEWRLEERDIVMSAAKTQTTIQEAPAIITVVTAATIRSYGIRTVSELLTIIPGFEGDRLDSNGWSREPLTRGNPRTVLFLWNGLPLNEPARNFAVLDRKLPMELIERVEITSGPGGVLWGSNALLGVVNIITRGAKNLTEGGGGADAKSLEATVGLGSGPGEQDAVEGSLSLDRAFWQNRISLYSNLYYFSSTGAELTLDHRKVLGVLPSPNPDGPTFHEVEPGTATYRTGQTDDNSRDWWFLWSGRLTAGPIALDWMLPWEEDYRQIATGGALLADRSVDGVTRHRLETRGSDAIRAFSGSYRDRFWEERLGLSLKLYLLAWRFDESPFGVYPRSVVLPQGLPVWMGADEDQLRYGGNLDADLLLGDHHLLFGGEYFRENVEGMYTSAVDLLCERARLTTGRPSYSFAEDPQVGYFGGEEACRYKEPLIFDTFRRVGAFFLTDEWRLHQRLILFAGGRLQASDSYDPTFLAAGSVVVNPWRSLHLKINYSEGLRPPHFTATHVNSGAHSGVTYEGNPDLDVERSHSLDTELNITPITSGKYINRFYLRANYGYTLLSDLIGLPGGRYLNFGSRQIHSVEGLFRLYLFNAHELWASYTYLQVMDNQNGPVRQIANQLASTGLELTFFNRRLALSTVASYVGPREDQNRDPTLGEDGSLILPDTRYIEPTDLVMTRLEPYVQWRVGLQVRKILDTFDLSAFLYNLLDLLGQPRSGDPDLFVDDRVQSQPLPREGWSCFVKLQAGI